MSKKERKLKERLSTLLNSDLLYHEGERKKTKQNQVKIAFYLKKKFIHRTE